MAAPTIQPTDIPSSLNNASASLARATIAQDAADERAQDRERRTSQADGTFEDPFGESEDDYESDRATARLDDPSSSLRLGMAGSYRRPSFIGTGFRPTGLPSYQLDIGFLSKGEREDATNEQRSLLRDNQIIPPKHPRRQSSSNAGLFTIARRLSAPMLRKNSEIGDSSAVLGDNDVEDAPPTETSRLLEDADLPYGGQDSPENIDKQWEEAVAAGMIQTTWQRETKVLLRYSRPLIVTFFLQLSLTMASIFTVGHLGKVQLAAATLASTTASITGYAIFQGLATSLDTLCPQAYGSGRKKLVGLQMLRMTYFLWLITIPIAIIWLTGTQILGAILPDKEVARLAGLYLKVLVIGAPGYAAFESGKRFVQAQGLFSATLYCLLLCAPLNIFLHWLFVFHLKWGFIGAPVSVVITENLLPICLFLYVYFVDGRECWGGFSRAAFKRWGPMIKLALPGLVMLLAEWMAFEILTLSSSWLGTTHLAAQSILNTIAVAAFQVPFSMSIAASTRIANLIGATLDLAAKTSAKVSLMLACCVGALNMTLLSSLRYYLPRLITDEEDVIELAATVLPLVAAFQLFDSFAAHCNGILRGIGRQEIGGYVNVICYYAVALPISFSATFGLHWDLLGLWLGAAVGLGLVAIIEMWFIFRANWSRAVEEAQLRNAEG